jgi:hypothetical protein
MNDKPKCTQMSARAVGVLAIAALAGCASGATSSAGVQYLPQPKTPTVKQVAAELHATGAVDCPGEGAGVGVTDAGTAYLGKERLGIDVFPTAALRDSWKAMSAGVGVVVIAQGQWWVAYKALSQTGKGCN